MDDGSLLILSGPPGAGKTAAGVQMSNAGFTVVLEGIFGPCHFGPVRDELTGARLR
jgi:ATP-dependent Lon protease